MRTGSCRLQTSDGARRPVIIGTSEANSSAVVAAARQIVSELRPLPAGRRVIMMRTHPASFIDTDPADFIGGAALRQTFQMGG